MNTSAFFKYILFASIACISFACSVSYSLSGKSIPPDVKTFSVAYIENRAQHIVPTLSDQVTEGLRDKYRTQAGLQMVQHNGHLQIEGRISDYSISYQGVTANQEAAQNRLTISVYIEFVNQMEPSKNFSRTFSASRDYDARGVINEEVFIPEILEQILEDIFMNSVATW